MSTDTSIDTRADTPVPGRIVSAEGRFPLGVPDDVVSVRGPNGQVVFCCPLRGVALTRPMAESVGITDQALEDVAWQRCPLGVSREQWDAAVDALQRIERVSADRPSVLDARFRVAVGGSAVAVFSSADTSTHKKQFPQNETQLGYMLDKAFGTEAETPLAERPERARKVAESFSAYRALDLDTPPIAPWFGAMRALHLEGSPDIDLQIHSPVIDRVLRERAQSDPSILDRMHQDRLHRWDPSDVYQAFPELVVFRIRVAQLSDHVDFEFLGPDGNARLNERGDWWHLETPVST